MTRIHEPAVRIRHHLKTPLTAILGHAQLVARGLAKGGGLGDEERAALLDQVAVIERMALALDAGIDALARETAEQAPRPARRRDEPAPAPHRVGAR